MSDRLITDLVPELQPLCQQFLANCKAVGIKVIITETLRSFAQQDTDYAQGRTTPGNIITNAKAGQSPHNFGKAFDFTIVTDSGILDWNASDIQWVTAIKIGEDLGLVSGSTFQHLKDYPHMELPNWKTTSLSMSQKSVIIPVNIPKTQGVPMLAAGWKTILFSFATIALGVLQSADFTNIIAQHPGPIVTGVGVLTLLLRLITNTGPGIGVSFTAKPSGASPVPPQAAPVQPVA